MSQLRLINEPHLSEPLLYNFCVVWEMSIGVVQQLLLSKFSTTWQTKCTKLQLLTAFVGSNVQSPILHRPCFGQYQVSSDSVEISRSLAEERCTITFINRCWCVSWCVSKDIGLHWCYSKLPTAQNMLRPIPGLISCAGKKFPLTTFFG